MACTANAGKRDENLDTAMIVHTCESSRAPDGSDPNGTELSFLFDWLNGNRLCSQVFLTFPSTS